MDSTFYAKLITDTISEAVASVGTGPLIQAFGLGHPLAPQGVDDYQNRARLLELANSARTRRPKEAKEAALTVLADSVEFLQQLQRERLRQAARAFNVALGVAVTGALIVLLGVILLFFNQTNEGTITASVGAITNIFNVLTFRLSRDANERLDKLAQLLGRIRVRKELIEMLPDSQEEQ
jgi:hypothetical protein